MVNGLYSTFPSQQGYSVYFRTKSVLLFTHPSIHPAFYITLKLTWINHSAEFNQCFRYTQMGHCWNQTYDPLNGRWLFWALLAQDHSANPSICGFVRSLKYTLTICIITRWWWVNPNLITNSSVTLCCCRVMYIL